MPRPAQISEKEQRTIEEAFDLGRRSMNPLDVHGDRLTRGYGGQWIILYGDEVVAHSEDSDEIQLHLERLGRKAEVAMVRYVHPPGTEFAVSAR